MYKKHLIYLLISCILLGCSPVINPTQENQSDATSQNNQVQSERPRTMADILGLPIVSETAGSFRSWEGKYHDLIIAYKIGDAAHTESFDYDIEITEANGEKELYCEVNIPETQRMDVQMPTEDDLLDLIGLISNCYVNIQVLDVNLSSSVPSLTFGKMVKTFTSAFEESFFSAGCSIRDLGYRPVGGIADENCGTPLDELYLRAINLI